MLKFVRLCIAMIIVFSAFCVYGSGLRLAMEAQDNQERMNRVDMPQYNMPHLEVVWVDSVDMPEVSSASDVGVCRSLENLRDLLVVSITSSAISSDLVAFAGDGLRQESIQADSSVSSILEILPHVGGNQEFIQGDSTASSVYEILSQADEYDVCCMRCYCFGWMLRRSQI